MDLSISKKINEYTTPGKVRDLLKNTKVVFLVGVTAAGKDTVLRQLTKKPDFHHIVSHTTRPPRENHGVLETNGVDYHFINLQTAEKMLDNGGFVEAKLFSGNVYGTSVAEIQMAHDEGKIAITDLEVQGAAEYCALDDAITPIFLLPPDFKTWQRRLSKRHEENQMDPQELRKRMETAELELREALKQNYFEYVINEDLQTTVAVVDQIAHGYVSSTKNDQKRHIAEDLLQDLDRYLAEQH